MPNKSYSQKQPKFAKSRMSSSLQWRVRPRLKGEIRNPDSCQNYQRLVIDCLWRVLSRCDMIVLSAFPPDSWRIRMISKGAWRSRPGWMMTGAPAEDPQSPDKPKMDTEIARWRCDEVGILFSSRPRQLIPDWTDAAACNTFFSSTVRGQEQPSSPIAPHLRSVP